MSEVISRFNRIDCFPRKVVLLAHKEMREDRNLRAEGYKGFSERVRRMRKKVRKSKEAL